MRIDRLGHVLSIPQMVMQFSASASSLLVKEGQRKSSSWSPVPFLKRRIHLSLHTKQPFQQGHKRPYFYRGGFMHSSEPAWYMKALPLTYWVGGSYLHLRRMRFHRICPIRCNDTTVCVFEWLMRRPHLRPRECLQALAHLGREFLCTSAGSV